MYTVGSVVQLFLLCSCVETLLNAVRFVSTRTNVLISRAHLSFSPSYLQILNNKSTCTISLVPNVFVHRALK